MPNILDPELTVILNPRAVQIAETARIDAFCKIEGGLGVSIGEHVHVASFSHINKGGGRLTIEDNVTISGATIITGTNDLLDWQQVNRKAILIGKGAVVFSGALVMANVGENAVVGAGAVVTKDVPTGEVWVGNPARFLKMRYPDKVRMAKINWDGYFDWYVRAHKVAPPYKPNYASIFHGLFKGEDTAQIYASIDLESKQGGLRQVNIPFEFVEVDPAAVE